MFPLARHHAVSLWELLGYLLLVSLVIVFAWQRRSHRQQVAIQAAERQQIHQALDRYRHKHQQSKARLRESEARFRNLIDGSIQGTIVLRGGKPLFVNQTYVEILSYDSPDEILHMEEMIPHVVAPQERQRL